MSTFFPPKKYFINTQWNVIIIALKNKIIDPKTNSPQNLFFHKLLISKKGLNYAKVYNFALPLFFMQFNKSR